MKNKWSLILDAIIGFLVLLMFISTDFEKTAEYQKFMGYMAVMIFYEIGKVMLKIERRDEKK